MIIAVPKETWPGECRVALVPESCKKLIQAGLEIRIEEGAGALAYFPDSAYREAGAVLLHDAATLFAAADLILKVQPPGMNRRLGRSEAELMRPGAILLTTLMPTRHLDTVQALAAGKITAFATDCIPFMLFGDAKRVIGDLVKQLSGGGLH